mgnify:CR=1 FL=1
MEVLLLQRNRDNTTVPYPVQESCLRICEAQQPSDEVEAYLPNDIGFLIK